MGGKCFFSVGMHYALKGILKIFFSGNGEIKPDGRWEIQGKIKRAKRENVYKSKRLYKTVLIIPVGSKYI